MKHSRLKYAAIAWTAAVLVMSLTVAGQSDAPQGAAGPYTAEQAARGKAAYGKACSQCHQDDLKGADYATGLVGDIFRAGWDGKPVEDLFLRARSTMPLDRPGALSSKEYADIVSYILQQNGMAAGPAELPSDPMALRAIGITVGRNVAK